MRWITKWIWEQPLSERDEQTLIALDHDAGEEGQLAGYGTWGYVGSVGTRTERHIEIGWFGVDQAYQGRRDDAGNRVADSIYATVETTALADAQSSDDMPFTLVCEIDNARGLRFWESHDYQLVPEPQSQVEDGIYYRMVR